MDQNDDGKVDVDDLKSYLSHVGKNEKRRLKDLLGIKGRKKKNIRKAASEAQLQSLKKYRRKLSFTKYHHSMSQRDTSALKMRYSLSTSERGRSPVETFPVLRLTSPLGLGDMYELKVDALRKVNGKRESEGSELSTSSSVAASSGACPRPSDPSKKTKETKEDVPRTSDSMCGKRRNSASRAKQNPSGGRKQFTSGCFDCRWTVHLPIIAAVLLSQVW
eukprot:CAMPEP_0170174242 /NCGR_PEP_ID=MMETSP0040_2-20121228/7484_1 /TAXON_ID=641309 /ORGANISM="Lotharella oceanica, Strain CCMP622" /LENGTH=218 /DNA_ID=CAMNT_0010415793 /DNA_START=146 /DNA_END=799 /DNA_ORIENTATION=-